MLLLTGFDMTPRAIVQFEDLQDVYYTLPSISAKPQAPTTGDSGLGFTIFRVVGVALDYFELHVALVSLG